MLPLYDYQKDAVTQMLRGRVLNTSQIGTGKTLMALGCIEQLNSGQSIVVAPKSLCLQWRDQIKLFLPDYAVEVVLGSVKARSLAYARFNASQKPRILVISYDLLRVDIVKFRNIVFDVAIFDEIHRLKEPNTKTKKIIPLLRSRTRYGLTGSPVVNHYGNLYNILSVLKPYQFQNYYSFINKWGVKNQWGGVLYFKNEQAIQQLFEPFMIRKTMADAGFELPPLSQIDVPVQLSEKELRIYDKIRKGLLMEFERADIANIENPVSLQNQLVKLGKLQEVADHLSLVGEHKESSKLETLKEILEDQVAADEKVIIFTRFKRMADILAKEIGALSITGDDSLQDRAETIKMFNESTPIDHSRPGKVSVRFSYLVMTNAGREGLNLQAANVVIHYDQDFTASGMEQRNGRAHRIGQNKHVRVYHLLCEDTIDYRVKRIIKRKAAMAESMLTLAEVKELLV